MTNTHTGDMLTAGKTYYYEVRAYDDTSGIIAAYYNPGDSNVYGYYPDKKNLVI